LLSFGVPHGFKDVSPSEALGLVDKGAVRVLDVRTPEEYQELGHVPGSLLVPVDLIASAPAILGGGPPILVCCEHGVRSRHAASFLGRAGFEGVLNLAGGMSVWHGPRDHSAGPVRGPSPWLLENLDLLPPRGTLLDVASGRGRHALLFAAAGWAVRAVDRDAEALGALAAWAEALELPVKTEVVDLEKGPPALGTRAFALIIVFRYLYRPLVPALIEALSPGGLLLYETYTKAQAEKGHPRNPAFLLEPGELLELFAPLEVLRHREGEFDDGCLASLAARKPIQYL
jgi:rhodanese-related sulfurtransferase